MLKYGYKESAVLETVSFLLHRKMAIPNTVILDFLKNILFCRRKKTRITTLKCFAIFLFVLKENKNIITRHMNPYEIFETH